MISYSISDYKVLKENINYELDEEIINIINNIAKKVGAKDYQKTPVFKRKYKNQEKISLENWESIRNFKQTELHVEKDTVAADFNTLRNLLNKLTKDNYEVMKMDLFEKIDVLLKEKDILNIIGEEIFIIGSSNFFWAELYANLYKDLTITYPSLKEICNDHVDKYFKVFENIIEVSAEKDYEKFCDVNKINERRKSTSSFLIHLMNNNVISIKIMVNIINKLFNTIDTNSGNIIYKIENQQLIENVCILIEHGHNKFKEYNEDDWDNMLEKIEEYSISKMDGISKKSSFKCLDLIDDIDDCE
jgi:hypothetical protein